MNKYAKVFGAICTALWICASVPAFFHYNTSVVILLSLSLIFLALAVIGAYSKPKPPKSKRSGHVGIYSFNNKGR